jgi:protease-4
VIPDATPSGDDRNAPRSCAPRQRRGPPRPRLLLLLLLSPLPLLGGCVSLQLFGGVPEPLVETVIQGERGPKILMLQIDGPISMSPPSSGLLGERGDSPTSRVREVLERARRDPEVRALLLRIDTPGGTASATDVVHGEILRFKRERRVPVVAHMVGTATSGGYYVAMAADHVVAHPTTITGSIGVIWTGLDFSGLMDKLGIENQTLTTGRYKDTGTPLRSMRPDERAHLQGVLDELQARFEAVVLAGRPGLDAARVSQLADGRIFTADQASRNGLVDEVADLDRAVEVTRERAGLSQARVVTYHRPDEYENNFYTAGQAAPTLRLPLPASLEWLSRPGFYYLWVPGLR